MKQRKQTKTAIIAGAIVVLLIAIFTLQYIPTKDSTPNSHKTPANEPAFSQLRDDGGLTFIDENGMEIISISMQIAANEQERMQGLMGITRMEERQGMLFIFENEEERSFWMANTPLPLDILFVNTEKRIVKIHRYTKPYSEESLPSNSPAQYVVEVNAGFCDKFGIIENQVIQWVEN